MSPKEGDYAEQGGSSKHGQHVSQWSKWHFFTEFVDELFSSAFVFAAMDLSPHLGLLGPLFCNYFRTIKSLKNKSYYRILNACGV